MFRYPKDEPGSAYSFYEGGYDEGMTTDLPDAGRLAAWLATSFAGTEKDLSLKVTLAGRLSTGRRVLDYGCSWGYGVLQFSRAGFDAIGYEVAGSRARFGRQHLGVPILSSSNELRALPDASFDIIFANHVLEHLHAPRIAFEDWRRLLAPNGVLLIFVPNAGGDSAKKLGTRWGPMIGEKHPLAVDASFLVRALGEYGLFPSFATSPYSEDALQFEANPDALPGDELLAVARAADPQGLLEFAGESA
jgi:SAM-dependent methyltransferase